MSRFRSLGVVLVVAICVSCGAASAQIPGLSLGSLSSLSLSSLWQYLQILDLDHNGSLSLSEMRVFIPGMTPELFGFLDKNGDGQITEDEFNSIATPDLILFVLDLAKTIDANGDWQLSSAEVNAFSPLLGSLVFSMLDTNGDGVISVADLPALIEPLLPSTCITADQIQSLIPGLNLGSGTNLLSLLDLNGDGKVCLDDFSTYIDQAVAFADKNLGSLNGLITLPPLSGLWPYLQALDTDHSGGLSLSELQLFAPGVTNQLVLILDKDNDGQVTPADLDALTPFDLVLFGLELYRTIDTNGDMTISADEAQAFSPLLSSMVLSELDTNGDGAITSADIPGIIQKFAPDLCVSFAQAQNLIPGITIEEYGLLDLNNDGQVCLNDFTTINSDTLKSLLNKVIALVDTNGDGGISLEELQAVLPFVTANVFNKLDRNGDGVLNLADLNGAPPVVDPATELRNYLLAADANGDGCLDYNEFKTLAPSVTQEQWTSVMNCLYILGSSRVPTSSLCIPATLSWGGLSLPDSVANEAFMALAPIISVFDKNGDQEVSLAEVQAIMPGFTANMFKFFDRTGDGIFSAADLTGTTTPPPSTHADPIDMVKAVFTLVDTNGDGCISDAEIAAAFPMLAGLVQNSPFIPSGQTPGYSGFCLDNFSMPDAATLNAISAVLMQLADTDHNGVLSFAEAQAFMPALTQDLFNYLDQNGDGGLSLADLGVSPPPPPPVDPFQQIVNLFLAADKNGDQCLSFAELQTLIPSLSQDVFALLDLADENPALARPGGDGLFCPLSPYLNVTALGNALAKIIEAADLNGDGVISLEEAQAYVPAMTPAIFAYLDQNGDGVLSAADFAGLGIVIPPPDKDPLQQLRDIYAQADQNHDGCLSFAELKTLIPSLTSDQYEAIVNPSNLASAVETNLCISGVLNAPIDYPDLLASLFNSMLALADANGDGAISLAEFQAVIPAMTSEIFAYLDQNGDGVLSQADLPVPVEDPMTHLIALLPQADANGDKQVTFDELKAVAPDLTQEQFAQLDVNGDGVITPDDAPGFAVDHRSQLLDLIQAADANGDGVVTFDEARAVRPDITEAQFAAMDQNGDGVLSVEDLPPSPVPDTTDLRQTMLEQLVKADTNHDGVLDYAEIAAAFPNAPAELLASIDTNHDWTISRDELIAALGENAAGQVIIAPEDENCDGSVDAVDLQIAVNAVLGRPLNVIPSDVDGNGRIDAVDIQLIIVKLLK